MEKSQETVTTKNGKEIPKNRVCDYCGNDKLDRLVSRKIRVNRQWQEMKFCCNDAGGMYQMGCEG